LEVITIHPTHTLLDREYLTGFSKRKQARKAAGQARAIKKEKEARLNLRKQVIWCTYLIFTEDAYSKQRRREKR